MWQFAASYSWPWCHATKAASTNVHVYNIIYCELLQNLYQEWQISCHLNTQYNIVWQVSPTISFGGEILKSNPNINRQRSLCSPLSEMSQHWGRTDDNYSLVPSWLKEQSCWMNNYIVRSYRDVIVITKFATRRTSKAQSKYSHVLKQKTY